MADDYSDSYNGGGTLGSVAAGGSETGTIDDIGALGDHDYFTVLLSAGLTYTFSMLGSGSLAGVELSLYDTNGTTLRGGDGNNGTVTDAATFTYTPAIAGTYYLDASASNSAMTGGYTIAVSNPSADDFRDVYTDTAEPLGAVTPGHFATGRIETALDVDVFTITLTAGKTYTFDLAKQGGSLDTLEVKLLAGNGAELVGMGGNAGTAHAQYAITTTGTYYVTAGGNLSATGDYKLSVSNGTTTPDDYRDTTGASGPLGSVAIGHTGNGKLEQGGDTDIFKVTLKAGISYTFDLKGAGSSGLADPELSLLKSNGSVLITDNDFNGTASRIVYTPSSSGTFYLNAHGHDPLGTGGYTISAKSGVDDAPGSKSSTVALPVDSSKLGDIETKGDQDYYKITLTAGLHYSFDLTGSTSEGATLANALLKLINSSGTLIYSNDDFNGASSHIFYTAPSTGTFYLDAGSHSSTTTGGYKISVSTSFDDVRDSIADTTAPSVTLAVNSSHLGVIESGGDHDLYTVHLTAGQTYTFDLASHTGAGQAIADTELTLLDSDGDTLIVNNDFNGSNSRIVYTATETDTFYVDAQSFSSIGTGVYQIAVRPGFDDFADSITDPASPLGALAANTSVMGTIETAGDSDVFKFNIVKGHHYVLEVTGGSGDTGLHDPDLRIFDTHGTMLAYSNDVNALDPSIDFNATASGVVYADVGGVGVGTGGYTVHLAEIA